MTTMLSNMKIRDGAGVVREVLAVDQSGTGAGPWAVVHILSTDDATAKTRTPHLTSASGSGSVAAGAKSVTISNTGAAPASVLGALVPAGIVISFDAPFNDVLGAISYDATGTTILIAEVR